MPPPHLLDPSLRDLLALHVESPDRLDVLLLARRERPKVLTARTLSAQLDLSRASAERELAILCGRGFLAVTIKEDLVYVYSPATDALDAHVAKLAQLWASPETRPEVLALLPLRALPRIRPRPKE